MAEGLSDEREINGIVREVCPGSGHKTHAGRAHRNLVVVGCQPTSAGLVCCPISGAPSRPLAAADARLFRSGAWVYLLHRPPVAQPLPFPSPRDFPPPKPQPDRWLLLLLLSASIPFSSPPP